MQLTLSFFPGAFILIDEKEYEDYAKFVPGEQLLTHQSLPGIAAIRNFILDTRPEQTIVMLDDDIKEIRAMVGKRARRVRDPESVRRIIENAVTILQDSGKHMLLFNRAGTPWGIQIHKPIVCGAGTPSGIMLFNGKREYKFDERLCSHEDNDYVLQVLLGKKDRFVFIDNRYFFEFCYKNNKGGLQSIRTQQRIESDESYLTQKWGQWMTMETSSQGNLFPKIQVRRKD